MISTAIHSRIANSDNTVTATLRSALVTELAPAGFTITASYDTDVPVLRPQPTCNSRVMFSGVGGSVQVNVAPVDCGDFGIVNSILLRFDAFPLGLTGLLALAYVAISNVGTGWAAQILVDLRESAVQWRRRDATVAALSVHMGAAYAADADRGDPWSGRRDAQRRRNASRYHRVVPGSDHGSCRANVPMEAWHPSHFRRSDDADHAESPESSPAGPAHVPHHRDGRGRHLQSDRPTTAGDSINRCCGNRSPPARLPRLRGSLA